MFQTPDQLCKRFSYPASLQALLEQLLVLAEQHIPHLHSFLLTGSVTTGDFVYEREGKLLPRRSLRRLAGDLLLASQLQQSLASKIKSLSSSSEAKLAALNLSLLAYTFHNADGNPPPELATQAAALSGEAASSATGFQFYCEVRRQLLTGLCRYSRSWREKEVFYLEVIQRAETGGW